MKVSVIIPAAGQGKRMRTAKNKQFLLLDDRPIIAHTVDKFNIEEVDEIILVVKEEEQDYCHEIIEDYQLKVDQLVYGGKTRQESVYNGLQKVTAKSELVLIHDGARPLLTKRMIRNIIKEAKSHQAVITGVAVKDTIKVINHEQLVINTPDRSRLVAIQTPQAFKKDLILKAYTKASEEGYFGTDSASLVERLNRPVKVIEGSYQNLKVTTPEDLEFAEKILARRQR
ncbi:2-C-methyl-D-erythritol 4-phosphate cytidylyltransferase [Natroniella sulfidigena]|uniref:2-C-methyl-D-erythritol 4-phosphate cytidylyltransferase n=1 Tax=Natroniella sulfidigena TaxID=723921 RepID=UPI00200A1908|nr:2-C-methyl-D-erythritol 4-phosphate cytidylyltransferase [Natroniella sulfidigena]MCK8816234.1 2-C-methyl-D-erythritol 4-phosphate cytidylyltransferase [Natroniella sulfidigena]